MTAVFARFEFLLRESPGGALTQHRVLEDAELTKLGDESSADGKLWIHVDHQGTQGWTRSENVRESAPVRTIAETELAAVSVAVAKDLQTNAGYLLAVAHLESRDDWRNGIITANADSSSAVAPYRFTHESWKSISESARGIVLGLREAGFNFPDQQCLAAGLKSVLDAEALTKGLGRFVSSLDLYLALIFGVEAAIALREPSAKDKKLSDIFDRLGLSLDLLSGRALLTMNQDGNAVVSLFLDRCRTSLQAGLERAAKLLRDFDVELPENSDASFSDVPTDFKGVVIKVEPDDVDALARLCRAEVGVFKQFGEQILADGVGAVIDTVFNRVVDDSTEFENSIQAVIDEKFQFSPISDTTNKTWRELAQSPETAFIVDAHLRKRASGGSSLILGAMHFFNPHSSNPGWGQEVQNNPTYIAGNPDTNFVHYHGFPRKGEGTYEPPGPYVIYHAGKGHAFKGNGSALSAITIPTNDDEVIKLLRRYIADGKLRFQTPKEKLRGMLLEMGPETATPALRRLVLYLAGVVDTFLEISSIVRPGAGSFHQTGQAVDIGNENIAVGLLPKVAVQSVVDQFEIDEIIFDARKIGEKTNRYNFNSGKPFSFGDSVINEHGDHIHFAVKS